MNETVAAVVVTAVCAGLLRRKVSSVALEAVVPVLHDDAIEEPAMLRIVGGETERKSDRDRTSEWRELAERRSLMRLGLLGAVSAFLVLWGISNLSAPDASWITRAIGVALLLIALAIAAGLVVVWRTGDPKQLYPPATKSTVRHVRNLVLIWVSGLGKALLALSALAAGLVVVLSSSIVDGPLDPVPEDVREVSAGVAAIAFIVGSFLSTKSPRTSSTTAAKLDQLDRDFGEVQSTISEGQMVLDKAASTLDELDEELDRRLEVLRGRRELNEP